MVEILHNKYQVPVFSIEDLDNISKVLNSKEFKDIYSFYASQIPDSSRLEQIPDFERMLGFYLYYTGQDQFLDQLDGLLYKKKLPTIQEFMKQPEYMGNSYAEIYQYWRDVLSKIFDPTGGIYECILRGAIGIGKSSIARRALLYVLYRVCCLRNPHRFFGIEYSTVISVIMISITLEHAENTQLKPMLELLRNTPCFHEVRKMTSFSSFGPKDPVPYCRQGKKIIFPNNIMLTVGSNNNHVVGMSPVGSSFDEAEEKNQEEAFSLYSNIRERIRSRFMGSSLTFCALMSSSKSKSGMVWEYINKIKPEDKETLLLDPAQWEVKKDAFTYSGKKFWIYIGTKTHPSRILPHEYDNVPLEKLEYVPPAGCDLLEVPIEYLRDFENNIEGAIQNLAGKTTDTSDRPFDDLSLLGNCPNLLPEVHLEAPLGDPIPLINKLPKDLFQETTLGPRLARYPNAPRFVHVDLASQSTSQAGYSLWHKEYIVNEVGERVTVFVADFISWITAPNRIDHDAIKQLSLDLRDKAGVYIKTISYDQFQCLCGDTKIVLTRSNSMTIKEIYDTYNKGDFIPHVLTFNPTTCEYKEACISAVRCSGYKKLTIVKLSNNQIVRCSDDHRFLLSSGEYVHACNLKKGNCLKTNPFNKNSKGKVASIFVKSVKVTDIEEEMYDISIENGFEPNFLLSAGVFVHNSEYVRQSLQQHHEFENVKYQSVDRDISAYLNFAQWIISGRIKVGKCPYLKEQLGHIGIIDRKIVTTRKKDMSDSCLAYDTKVFLLSGKILTVEELYNSNIEHEWILACDVNNKKLVPVKIEDVLQKHIPSTLIQFTLSNGKTLSVTDDHLILMKSGEYKRADEIEQFDELMPFNYYHELNYHDKYRKVVNPFKGTAKFLYKIVSQELLSEAITEAKNRALNDGSKFTVIHHKSHNKNDDRPENLVPLTNIEHTNLHAMTGKEIKAFHDRTVLKRERSKIINEGLALMKKVNPEGYRRYLLKHDIADKLAEQKAKVENLKVYVTQITRVDNDKPVYDIVLNSIHNFALDCNVFVHNCVGSVNNAYLDATPVEYPFIDSKKQDLNLNTILGVDDSQEIVEV